MTGIGPIHPDDEDRVAANMARELEALGEMPDLRPAADFTDRVMAAIEREPVPQPAVALGSALRAGRFGLAASAVGDAFRVAFGGIASNRGSCPGRGARARRCGPGHRSRRRCCRRGRGSARAGALAGPESGRPFTFANTNTIAVHDSQPESFAVREPYPEPDGDRDPDDGSGRNRDAGGH